MIAGAGGFEFASSSFGVGDRARRHRTGRARPSSWGLNRVGGKVSSLDLKWAVMRSMSVSWMRTRTCSAGRPMAVVLSVGLSPCWIARSLSGNAATGSKAVSGSLDRTPTRMVWVVPVSGGVAYCL